MKESLRPDVRLALLALFSLAVAGIWFATRWGIGASPDSVIYLGAARNVLAGRGLSVPFGDKIDQALTHFPPLYPALLAALGVLKIDPLVSARGLSALLFGANLLLVALGVHQITPHAAWLPAIGAGLMLVSPSMFSLHLMAWTEAPFIFLGLMSLLMVARYIETTAWKYLVASSLLLALALLTRYAGLALLATGALSISIFGSGAIRRRVGRSLALGLISFTPTLAWTIRNLIVADTVANRSLAFHPITVSHFRQALETTSAWLLIPDQAPTIIKLGGVLMVFTGLVVMLHPRSEENPSTRSESLTGLMARRPVILKLLTLFLGIYALFLVGSISFLDANTPLDARILSPVYISGLLVGVYGIGRLLESPAYLTRLALIAVGLLFGTLSTYRVVSMFAEATANGVGFNHQLWRESPTLAWVNHLPPATLIYSNAPEAVYLHTGRSALRLPRTFQPMDQQINSNYTIELDEMRQRLEAEAGVVVYFEAVHSQSILTAATLRESLPLDVLYDSPDGDVYALAAER